MVRKKFSFILFLLLLSQQGYSQDDSMDDDLKGLLDEADVSIPFEDNQDEKALIETPSSETIDLNQGSMDASDSDMEAVDLDSSSETVDPIETTEEPPIQSVEKNMTDDDLETLKLDIGESTELKEDQSKSNVVITPIKNFDAGREEADLLRIAETIKGQISDNDWNEVATAARVETYTVVVNDWLFKISKKLFGSGYYYPKIWSLNPYITNPHFIEPGMILSFTTGSGNQAPEFKLGTFTDEELNQAPGTTGDFNPSNIDNFGDDATPPWLSEKQNLVDKGIYFQYASNETMEDLVEANKEALNKEYDHYEPPKNEFEFNIPKNYDNLGFDKNSRIFFSYKEGFYLSTFLSMNIVQDFGVVNSGPDENVFFTTTDRAYVKFDESVKPLPGDMFSVYTAGGQVTHKNSDRKGYKYSITAQIKVIRKVADLFEVEFVEVSGTPQRGDRITAYTPKIDRITRTYNSRMIEAAIMGAYEGGQNLMSYGDVVYIDRGRADGVEMGNVFDVYGFKDRLTGRNIADQPTYKVGELTVITLTDNFATALVTGARRDFYSGAIAITKTKEAHLREATAKNAKAGGEADMIGGKALEELDVELNLDNLNEDLLKHADSIRLTEDELSELERQEREKSVIRESERDLKALERLEREIEHAEKIINDANLDEDKLLESQSLNGIEKSQGNIDQEALDEIEENLGKRYMDEDLNSKDNPYGLTEFDVEEIDELLNVEKKQE